MLKALKNYAKEYQYPTIYSLLGVFLCYDSLTKTTAEFGTVFIVICCIICYVSVLSFCSNYKIVEKFFCNKVEKILLVLITGVTAFCFTGSHFLISEIELFSRSSVLNWVETCLWMFPVIVYFYFRMAIIEPSAERNKLSAKLYILGTLGILLFCAIFLVAFNPAITSPDSVACLNDARLLQNLLNWHPPFYVIVLGALVRIYDSVTFVIIIQDIYFALVFMSGISFLKELGVSKRKLILFYLFVATSFSNIIQLVTLWKDIPFMISLLWLTILLGKLVLSEHSCLTHVGWNIQFVISIIFTCFFRQNGILPALAVVVLLPLVCKLKKKALISSCVCFLLIGMIIGPLYNHFGVVQVPGLKYFALSNDILYTYYNNDESSDEIIDMVNEITSNDPENWKYNVFHTKYNRSALGDYSVPKYLGVYISNYFRHTRAMTFAFLARNQYLWSVSRAVNAIDSCVNHTGQAIQISSANIPERKANILTEIIDSFSISLTKLPTIYIVYWRVGIYNVIIILCFFYILVRNKIKRLKMCLPFIPIILNCFALCAGSGWPDYRYYWPSVVVGIFLMLMTPMLIQSKVQ